MSVYDRGTNKHPVLFVCCSRLIDLAQFIHALLRRDNGMQLVAFNGSEPIHAEHPYCSETMYVENGILSVNVRVWVCVCVWV